MQNEYHERTYGGSMTGADAPAKRPTPIERTRDQLEDALQDLKFFEDAYQRDFARLQASEKCRNDAQIRVQSCQEALERMEATDLTEDEQIRHSTERKRQLEAGKREFR